VEATAQNVSMNQWVVQNLAERRTENLFDFDSGLVISHAPSFSNTT